MCREPKPWRALTSTGKRRSAGTSVGSHVGGDGKPALLEQSVREVLVAEPLDELGLGEQHEGAELVAVPSERHLVEVGERDDQLHVVTVDELAERGDVAGVVDARDELEAVGQVGRGCEPVRVGRDRRRSGCAERADDVHPLAGAREENRGHGGSG